MVSPPAYARSSGSGSRSTHHSDEQPRLLRSAAHTSVADDANGETRSETSETDGQAGAELDEALV